MYEVTANTGAVNYDDSAAADFVINGSITSSTIENGHVIFGAVIRNSNLPPTAGDSDTTNGSWSSIVNLGLTGTATFSSQYKIVNASGAQTYDITTGVSGVIGWVEIS